MSTIDLIELLARASEHTSRVEFMSPRGTTVTSFDEIWRWSGHAARALQRMTNGGRVAGVLSPSPQAIACGIGCLRAGLDFLSLPLPGRAQSSGAYTDQVRTIMRAAGAEVLLLDEQVRLLIDGFAPALLSQVMSAERMIIESGGNFFGDPTPGCLIQFSSGTTGAPKGIVLTTTNIGASVVATLDALGIRPGDKSCQWLPLSHDMGLIGGLFAAWAGADDTRLGTAPGHYVCMSPELFLARPLRWLETCAAMGASITAAPNFAYQVLARQLRRSAPLDLSKLRVALVGAEPVLPQTLEAFVEAARPHRFDERALCPSYGLAEATLAVSVVPPEQSWSAVELDVDGEKRSYVSCGRVLDCVQVDAPRGGKPGPILVRGSVVSQQFVPERPRHPEGWIDSRDLGTVVAGELVVTGRSDDMLCIAGRNVFAWELENEASRVPGIQPGCCVIVPDAQGRYVLLFEAATGIVAPGEMLPAARGTLAAYAGVGPSAIGCMPKGSLPKTPSGKLQRNKVRIGLHDYLAQCTVTRSF